MANESFARIRDGWRFLFNGMKTNAAPDSLPPGKHPIAVNIRGYRNTSVETRPGTGLPLFTTHALPVTDLRSYVALGTDGKPRTLARESDDSIWLDNSTQVGTLATGGPGATLIPFRPDQSPNPYMYIANGADYQKFSAPNPTVVASKVGIAEPQDACESAQIAQQFVEVLSPGGNWNTGGTASAWTSGDRSHDIVVTSIADPVSPFREGGIHAPAPPRWAIQVSPTVQYQRGEIVYFNSASNPLITIIEEVIPPLAISMAIQAIFYKQGPPGVAVIVLQGVTAASKSSPQQTQSGIILDNTDIIAQMVRGALLRVGSETTFLRSVTSGPDNQLCIEVFLNNLHVVGETIIGLPTIIVNNVQNAASVATGTPVVGDMGNTETFSVAVGVGTLTTGPPGGGPTGTIIARPVTSLNGWGPNAHVGAYEMGVNQGYNFGLDPSTTSPYANPGNAFDANTTTFASAVGQHTHTYYGCVWAFLAGVPQSNMVLNINSRVLANGDDGFTVNKRSAGIWYSLDNSVTWNQIYNQGSIANGDGGPRPQQWDSIPLPANQDITQVQVMAFTDSHDDMVHYVYEINISAGAASIGVNTGAFQESDYLHFSINVDDPSDLSEIKLQFDVSDGTFNSNYYYYSVRPSDLVSVSANTVSQLGAIQAIIAETETSQQARDAGLRISDPSVAGQGQWTEVWTPISGLTRIGGDQTKTLATINAVQVLVNALDTIRVSVSSIAFVGGGQPDVGDVGEPYRYRARPRSSVTGAIGNPSPDMRYGIPAVRQPVQVNLPSAGYDSQIDRWDIFRFGGSVPEWRFIGSVIATSATFEDNYDDAAATAGDVLDFDNFEPWPSIDFPLNAIASTIVGTEAVVTIPAPTNALRFLPGNLVNLGGQNVYTLRKRPTLISGTSYLFEFNECTAGFNQGIISDNGQVTIYEPEIARQFLPYMWGPDVNGTVFAVGDPLRPGTLYMSKPNNPDSAPDSFNLEIVPPSEPLLGGEALDGLSFVGSTMRWWALYPQLDNPTQRYNPVQQPFERGLAAPFGHCNDGQSIYWWAEDGIWDSKDGSLTDADLYNIFPHEGVAGVPITYGPPVLGRTIQPPDYSRAGTFRLVYCDSFLYAIYQDTTGAYDMLVCDLRRKAWSVDVYPLPISAMYNVEQQVGTLVSAPALYPDLMLADIGGNVFSQTPFANDNGTPISCILATNEFDGGDLRAPKQWGDYFLDALVSTAAGVTLTPMSLGAIAAPASNVPNGATRQQSPLSVNGIVVSQFMGLFITWTDDFTTQTNTTRLHIWDISFAVQPAATIDFSTFGTSFGAKGYEHIREIALAYVSTAPVTLAVTSYDGLSPAALTFPSSGGQYVKILLPLTANKGQLYRFRATSTAKFQLFLEDCEIRVGQFERTGPYAIVKQFSGDVVSPAPL